MSIIHGRSDQQRYEVKVVLLGDSGVGKTSFFEKYISNCFSKTAEPTKNAVYETKVIVSSDNKIKVQLVVWDTAGQEIYRSLAPSYYKDANIIFFIYDITKRESFDNLKYWTEEVKSKGPKDCIKTILGNKCDRIDKEAVKESEAIEFAARNNATSILVSAKEDINIDKAFENALIRLLPNLKNLFDDTEVENKHQEVKVKKGTKLVKNHKKTTGCACT